MNATSVFRHPHLTRGVVHTTKGNFVVQRGLVRVPDAVGDQHGWQRVDPADHGDDTRASASPRQRGGGESGERSRSVASTETHGPNR
jgi:hypothetical protein